MPSSRMVPLIEPCAPKSLRRGSLAAIVLSHGKEWKGRMGGQILLWMRKSCAYRHRVPESDCPRRVVFLANWKMRSITVAEGFARKGRAKGEIGDCWYRAQSVAHLSSDHGLEPDSLPWRPLQHQSGCSPWRSVSKLNRRFCTRLVHGRVGSHSKMLKLKSWLPGMGSNHELDRFLKSHNLLILKTR